MRSCKTSYLHPCFSNLPLIVSPRCPSSPPQGLVSSKSAGRKTRSSTTVITILTMKTSTSSTRTHESLLLLSPAIERANCTSQMSSVCRSW